MLARSNSFNQEREELDLQIPTFVSTRYAVALKLVEYLRGGLSDFKFLYNVIFPYVNLLDTEIEGKVWPPFAEDYAASGAGRLRLHHEAYCASYEVILEIKRLLGDALYEISTVGGTSNTDVLKVIEEYRVMSEDNVSNDEQVLTGILGRLDSRSEFGLELRKVVTADDILGLLHFNKMDLFHVKSLFMEGDFTDFERLLDFVVLRLETDSQKRAYLCLLDEIYVLLDRISGYEAKLKIIQNINIDVLYEKRNY